MNYDNVLFAFALTLFAGLSTGIGGLMGVLSKSTNQKFLCISLGFSAGVMIYVAFMDLIPTAQTDLFSIYGQKTGTVYLLMAFFVGIILMNLIENLVPKSLDPHNSKNIKELDQNSKDNASLKRTGLLVAASLALHNIPEGIATFGVALTATNVSVPLSITLAIAIHSIPEGLAVAVPIYHATGSRKKALGVTLLAGLTEPLGALLAYLFLMPFWTPQLSGLLEALVAGIMVFISFDELLPSAEKYGKHHLAMIGVFGGMLVMAISLFLFL